MRGRRTFRADVLTQLIGHALGGRPGERLMSRIGLPVSDDTILRRLKKSAPRKHGVGQLAGRAEKMIKATRSRKGSARNHVVFL